MSQAHRVLCTVTTDALICRNSEGGKGVFAATMPGRHAPIESPASRRAHSVAFPQVWGADLLRGQKLHIFVNGGKS